MNPRTPPITNVNLKLLQTFVLVAEYGSFHRAADQTYRSQSAVSSQIRQLEQQLGFSLFHRTTRSVQLTSDGAQLLPHAEKALEEVSLGLQRIFGGGPRESVTFACLPTIAALQIPGLLAAFRRKYPSCGVYIRELDAVDLFESVRRGEVDFGIAADNRGKEFVFEPLFDDVYVALVPAKFVTSARISIALAELAAQPLLLFNPTGKISRSLAFALQATQIEVKTRCQFRQIQTVLSMVEAGLGTTILPQSSLPTKLPESVKILEIYDPEVTRRVSIVQFRGRPLTTTAASLIEVIRQQCDSSGPSVPSDISSFPPLVAVSQKGRRA